MYVLLIYNNNYYNNNNNHHHLFINCITSWIFPPTIDHTFVYNIIITIYISIFFFYMLDHKCVIYYNNKTSTNNISPSDIDMTIPVLL